ncbi:helix-turn-helix domain-containing protein [Rhodococcus aetherivorans]
MTAELSQNQSAKVPRHRAGGAFPHFRRTMSDRLSDETEWLTVRQACDRAGVSRRTMETLMAQGNIPTYRLDGTSRIRRIRTADLDAAFREATA